MLSPKQKQDLVKWIYQVGIDYLEDVKTYEDASTYQQTQMNIISFISSEIPQRISELEL